MKRRSEKGQFITVQENNIIQRMKEKHPKFEYISGYEHCESNIKIKCKTCNDIIEKNAQILRKNRLITCKNCLRIEKEQREAKRKEQLELDRVNKIKQKELIRMKELTCQCAECGSFFIASKKGKKYCSDKCSTKRNTRIKDLRRRNQLKINGDVDYSISLSKLIKYSKSQCAICNDKVDKNDYITTKEGYFLAGDNYPSIDHILPIARGGTHTWDNVQLAHRKCNSAKSDKINKPIQLSLFAREVNVCHLKR